MQAFVLEPREAFAILVEACLDAECFWHNTYVDRAHRALFATANRHYLELDSPGERIGDAHEAFLARLDRADADLLEVPRISAELRSRLMQEHIEQLDPEDEPRRTLLLERKRARELRPDDFWRPGALDAFADDDPIDRERWVLRVRYAAAVEIVEWLRREQLTLVQWVRYVFA